MEKETAARAAYIVRGNCARIKKLMKRAETGADVRIGFLGGSITQGSLASTPEKCYAALVYRWWEKTFPRSRCSYINAGIGGTSSLFGAARAWTDLMCRQPDFVVVDFSVNDEALPVFQEAFEGVIRQLFRNKHTSVMILNNCFYNDGRNAQELHNEVAVHYQIPTVSMREGLYAMIQDGTFSAGEVTPDFLHPNDKGHAMLAYMINYQLDRIHEDMDHREEEPEYPPALTRNRFEAARRWQTINSSPRLQGFLADLRKKTALLDLYKNGWTAGQEGDSFTLELECSYIAVQYLRSVHKPRPIAQAVTDGENLRVGARAAAEAGCEHTPEGDGSSAHTITLDGNFDEDWGDCLALTEILNEGQRRRHRLTISIKEAHPSDAGPFYLVSVITD